MAFWRRNSARDFRLVESSEGQRETKQKKKVILYDPNRTLEDTLRGYSNDRYDIEYVPSRPDLIDFRLNVEINPGAPIILSCPSVIPASYYKILNFLKEYTNAEIGAKAMVVYESRIETSPEFPTNVFEVQRKYLDDNLDTYMDYLLEPLLTKP